MSEEDSMTFPDARQRHLEQIEAQAKRVVAEQMKLVHYPVEVDHPIWRQIEILSDKLKGI